VVNWSEGKRKKEAERKIQKRRREKIYREIEKGLRERKVGERERTGQRKRKKTKEKRKRVRDRDIDMAGERKGERNTHRFERVSGQDREKERIRERENK
jgi:hypothetical protein